MALCAPLPPFTFHTRPDTTPFHIPRVDTLAPAGDHLSLPPVIYNVARVRKRARLVAVQTQFKDAEDAEVQTISPYISFCISQQEHSFTILHGDALARIPGRPIHQAPLATRFVEPELLHGCFWSLNAIPYMGFLPVNPYRVCFADSLFACVFQRKWDVPIHHDGKQWQVSPQLAGQWQQLEHILVFLRNLLSASRRVHGSQEHLPAPLPSHYRFHRPHPDPLILSKRVMRARYGFLLLGRKYPSSMHCTPILPPAGSLSTPLFKGKQTATSSYRRF
ncbi:hypothetical protein BDZ89DRAFT_1140435 [Hymenopellis radicata]|nr:hypothetical protein BDZ89DRAFT_1140435 [Hymenopellis radicata]